MKNLFSAALRSNEKCFPVHQLLYSVIRNSVLFFGSMILICLFFAGCKKGGIDTPANVVQSMNARATNSEENAINNYTGLSPQTAWELQQARSATARYRNINNAIADGYSNIAVDVENMGHHYMNSSLVDATFDIRKPEILVYNRNEDGSQELVAVEYAIPLTDPRPEGFTGSLDVWNGESGFPLWLVHAWVWSYNPDGVFNWTNPTVHLH